MKTLIILLALLINTFPDFAAAKGNVSCPIYQASAHSSDGDTSLTNLRIRPFHLDIVPPSSGIRFYRDGIIFLAHTKSEENVPERHLSFGSVRAYSASIADTMPGQLVPFDLKAPALYPTEATTFSSDYNTMYLSLIPEKANNEKIFRAVFYQSEWKIDDKPMDICEGNYIYSHPHLSADGSFMIFSSDMPGSKGGLDLFITHKEGNSWGKPENLGKSINSSGNELFASLDSKNNLYFSSDGHPGKGGYDVYVCKYNGTGWENPLNLSAAINTDGDELAFSVNRPEDNIAFYSSRVRSGKFRTLVFILDNKSEVPSHLPDRLSESLLALAGAGPNQQQSDQTGDVSTKKITISNQPILMEQTDDKTPSVPEPLPNMIATDKNENTTNILSAQPANTTEQKKEAKVEAVKAGTADAVRKDEVVYRVQILANTKPVGSQTITVSGNSYKSFEYLYKGGYRTTIGEFSTLADAARLQSICRQNGYKEAFVVAFKNNTRSTDPELFK